MSEEKKESFADLFARAEPVKRRRFELGERLRVAIVQVGKDGFFVELDQKRQAFLSFADFGDLHAGGALKAGDTIEVTVVGFEAGTGEVLLGRTLGKPQNLAALEQARDTGVAIEGKVTGVNKGGLEVELAGTRAFCPASQVDLRFTQDLSVYVGRTLSFSVVELRDGGKSVVLSRRAILERDASEARSRVLATLAVGQVVRGTISSVQKFGAFVDLGGLEGLVPMSELSHDRSARAEDIVTVGDVVEVAVREIKHVQPERPHDPPVKVTLSLKSLAQDPWDLAAADLVVGKVFTGHVTRIAEFGLFVRILPGIEGLLHVSELGGRANNLRSSFKVGDPLAVRLDQIDRAARKLSLAPAPDGVDAGAVVATRQVLIGSVVEGVVERVESFGVFVQLDGTKGKTGRALVPNSELNTQRGSDTRKLFPEGARVRGKIIEASGGKLKMSIRALHADEERAEFEGYRQTSGAPQSLGTFGDLLKKSRPSGG